MTRTNCGNNHNHTTTTSTIARGGEWRGPLERLVWAATASASTTTTVTSSRMSLWSSSSQQPVSEGPRKMVYSLKELVETFAPHLAWNDKVGTTTRNNHHNHHHQNAVIVEPNPKAATNKSLSSSSTFVPHGGTVEWVAETTLVVPLPSWPLIPVAAVQDDNDDNNHHQTAGSTTATTTTKERTSTTTTTTTTRTGTGSAPKKNTPSPPTAAEGATAAAAALLTNPAKKKKNTYCRRGAAAATAHHDDGRPPYSCGPHLHHQREPLSSLVDHVVWTLVQRRERARRRQQSLQWPPKPPYHTKNRNHHHQYNNHQYYNNVLCQGYTLASSSSSCGGGVPQPIDGGGGGGGGGGARTMPTGVVMWHLNAAVEFLKQPLPQNHHPKNKDSDNHKGHNQSCRWGPTVHHWLGDDFLRLLLLHCQVFLPIVGNDVGGGGGSDQNDEPAAKKNHQADPAPPSKKKKKSSNEEEVEDERVSSLWFRGNYWQLAGPPVGSVMVMAAAAVAKEEKEKKKTPHAVAATAAATTKRPQQPTGHDEPSATAVHRNENHGTTATTTTTTIPNATKPAGAQPPAESGNLLLLGGHSTASASKGGRRSGRKRKRRQQCNRSSPNATSTSTATAASSSSSSKPTRAVSVGNASIKPWPTSRTTTTTNICRHATELRFTPHIGLPMNHILNQPLCRCFKKATTMTTMIALHERPDERNQEAGTTHQPTAAASASHHQFSVVVSPTHDSSSSSSSSLDNKHTPENHHCSSKDGWIKTGSRAAARASFSSAIVACSAATATRGSKKDYCDHVTRTPPEEEEEDDDDDATAKESSGLPSSNAKEHRTELKEAKEENAQATLPCPERILWWLMTTGKRLVPMSQPQNPHASSSIHNTKEGKPKKKPCNNSQGRKANLGCCHDDANHGNDLAREICQSVVRNHQKCDYARILNHYCPLPDYYYHDSRLPEQQQQQQQEQQLKRGSHDDTLHHSPSGSSSTKDESFGEPQQPQRPAREKPTRLVEHVDLAQVSASFTPALQVLSFVKSILTRVFPPEFWGSSQNLSRILHQVECFVNLRRQEQFPFHKRDQLLKGIRITKVAWLFDNRKQPATMTRRKERKRSQKSTQEEGKTASAVGTTQESPPLSSKKGRRRITAAGHQAAEQRFLSVIEWLFQDFLIPLLRSCFHATESEMYVRRVLYYRKPVWSLFCALSMAKLRSLPSSETRSTTIRPGKLKNHNGGSSCMYQALTVSEAAAKVTQQEMGLSRLRLLPKRAGVRPIALQSSAARIKPPPKRSRSSLPPSNGSQPTTLAKKRKLEEKEQKREEMATATAMLVERKPSTNATLNDAFAVLRKQYLDDPGLFGAGVAGLHFFYPRYRQFLLERRRCRQSDPCSDDKPKQLFFASVDIQSCYDQINQEKLLELVDRGLLNENQYMLQRMGVTHCKNGNNGSGSTKDENFLVHQADSVLHRKYCHVESPETFEPTGQALLQKLNKEYHNAIIRQAAGSNGGVSMLSKKRLMGQLKEHLKSHILVTKGRFNEQFLVQSRGIPQGSILSSLLCNLYYGSVVEKSLGLGSTASIDMAQTGTENGKSPAMSSETTLKSPPTSQSMLARMVDDFLLVAENRAELTKFIETMDKGDRDLGAQINKDKTRVSAKVTIQCAADPNKGSDQRSTEACFKPHGTRRLFPWCGMLFDTRTGEVRIDYSRFHDGKARDGLNIDYTLRAGAQQLLLTQLQMFVRPRCIPILFDPLINSERVQCINFYQLMLFAAVKLVFYLDDVEKVLGSGTGEQEHQRILGITTQRFLLDCLQSTIAFAYRLIESRMKQYLQHGQRGGTTDVGLKREQAFWLGWKAVHDVFQRFQRLAALNQQVSQQLVEAVSNRWTDHVQKRMSQLARQARREMEPTKLLSVSS